MALSVPDVSGVLVKPPRPGGAKRKADTRAALGAGASRKKVILMVVGAAVLIGAAGAGGVWWSMRSGGSSPGPAQPAASLAASAPGDDRAKLQAELAEAKALAAKEKAAADELRKREAELARKAAEAAELQKKLADVVKDTGSVTQNGSEIHLELVDKVLFPLGEAELTPRGAAVLAKIGTALNEIPDKQVWVQGHTDDTPIRAPKPAPAPKGKGKGKPVEAPAPRFATNWELSAARALTVVHYLQDQGKVDPRRLAAVAFSEYRPASRVKARNRRIEIVLYPKHQLARE